MSLFKKPNELEFSPTIKMLVYGQPGIGKSTLALSAPSPVLLDFDGGVKRVNSSFYCPTLQVKSWDEVLNAMNEDLSEFKTIVIDTAGKMLDYMSAYIIKNDSKMAMRDGSLSLKGYGARKTMFINFLTRCSMMGKHLVFVAHEREESDGDNKVIRPEIGGSSAGDLIKELDLVGYMKAIGKDRTIFWNPEERYYAKNTCNLPDSYKIPVVIDGNGMVVAKNDFLTKVFDSYENYLKSQKEMQVQYEELIQQITEDVSAITDIETANKAVERILFYDPIWDSKLRANSLIKAKTDELGLKYNKATKSYEVA